MINSIRITVDRLWLFCLVRNEKKGLEIFTDMNKYFKLYNPNKIILDRFKRYRYYRD